MEIRQDILKALGDVLEQRKAADPDGSYTAKLLSEAPDSILKKIGEEAAETIIASKSGDKPAIIHEIADLWFHTIVLLTFHDLEIDAVLAELQRRFGLSGLEEKANRKN